MLDIFTELHNVQDSKEFLPCKPGVAGSIPGFNSLSDETLSRGPVSIWP